MDKITKVGLLGISDKDMFVYSKLNELIEGYNDLKLRMDAQTLRLNQLVSNYRDDEWLWYDDDDGGGRPVPKWKVRYIIKVNHTIEQNYETRRILWNNN